jgi:hypothetical protein
MILSVVGAFQSQNKAINPYYACILDTYTYQDSPSGNYGTSTTLGISGYSSYIMGTFLKFDISSIPANAIIDSAKLWLYKHYINTNGDQLGYTIRRLTASWLENTLTYDNSVFVKDSSVDYGSPYFFGAINEWKEHSITTLVQQWVAGTYPNYGLHLINFGTGYRQNSSFRSREYGNGSYAPYLEITYHT